MNNSNDSKENRINKEEQIKKYITDLKNQKGLIREKARKKLVDVGVPAVDHLSEMTNHPERIARWEAVKTLSEIKDPHAAPLLIKALEDHSEDVRWIAAEGLSALGTAGLSAILEALKTQEPTIYLRNGAHHILTRLKSTIDKPIIKELLQILEKPDAELKLPLKIMGYVDKTS